MRSLLLLFALVGLSLPISAAAPRRQWDVVATPGPADSIVIGNPAAPVRLTEYLSYTCSHCARFAADSDADLRRGLIRQGRVSLQVRNLYRDPLDLAAALVARCRPTRMAAIDTAIFAAQDSWIARANQVSAEVAGRNRDAPRNRLLKDFAQSTGLVAIALHEGVSQAQIDACFATDADITRLAAQHDATPSAVAGTPSFAIADRLLDVNTWGAIQPLLQPAAD